MPPAQGTTHLKAPDQEGDWHSGGMQKGHCSWNADQNNQEGDRWTGTRSQGQVEGLGLDPKLKNQPKASIKYSATKYCPGHRDERQAGRPRANFPKLCSKHDRTSTQLCPHLSIYSHGSCDPSFFLHGSHPLTQIPQNVTLEPCNDHTQGAREKWAQREVKQGASLEEGAGRDSGCLCWITIWRILNHRQYRLSKVIKPERKNVAQEFWQHRSKAVKDFVFFDTAILLPRIYSKEMIKGVSKDADHSCDHNSKKKMETTKMSNTRGQLIKLKYVHRMDSFATILKKEGKKHK